VTNERTPALSKLLVSRVSDGLAPRLVGWASIASGTLGILALTFLVLALRFRASNAGGASKVAFRAHDLGTVLQALLMIPAVLLLSTLAGAFHGRARRLVALGVIGEATVALFLMLTFAINASNMLDMLPQGLVGLWLILVSIAMRYTLSRGTTRIGIVAGTGLVVIALSLVGIAVALGPAVVVFTPSAAPPVDPAAVSSVTNRIAHQALGVGTLLGRTLYPLWAISVGIRFVSGMPVEHSKRRSGHAVA
jgi:hypothetical protein